MVLITTNEQTNNNILVSLVSSLLLTTTTTMEIQFQQPNQNFVIQTKANHNKGNNKLKTRRNNNSNRFVGVRQRPSGRWVAEIKDTTQKIRMWLGTFETAEQAARAYDEAAWLLRGSNTRTNFITTHVSSDSPLASRIHNLLNKRSKQHQHHQGRGGSTDKTATTIKVNTTTFMVSESISSSSSSQDQDQDQDQDQYQCTDVERLFENTYKPDLSVLEDLQPSLSWGFGEVMDLSNNNNNNNNEVVVVPEFSSEFERMKVERQISASLYAMNGVQEYMETIHHDPAEAFWDLPPLCSLLC